MGGRLSGWQQLGSLEALAELDLDDERVIEGFQSAQFTTCAGWRIAGWGLLKKHEAKVREMLAPKTSLDAEARSYLRNLRERSEIVAGVLIRQSDYRTWRGGEFYHTSSQYARWMHHFRDHHRGKAVAFLVTSDEVQDPAVFSGLNVVFSSGSANMRGSAISAILELACCDVVLAPPSTLSAWAAHWGGVPYHVLSDHSSCPPALPGDIDALRLDPVLSQVVK
jgi:hypothetical protein